jgi:hypothetical protein
MSILKANIWNKKISVLPKTNSTTDLRSIEELLNTTPEPRIDQTVENDSI